ncbi:MAG: DUF72 domain-containing protein [Gammaproteobacteria bacterium]|nr:DUF72 domain-containing protein [Gammaproteobacteria bacterium]NKB64919.1 DUF72 domain-containing protein [Gammaproteobacteria bacterium]
MKFGKTAHPEQIDFTLPLDHRGTQPLLDFSRGKEPPIIHVGCAKWNRQDLRNFYPRGIKDELSYYSAQFNTIELNATFYRIFPSTVFAGWKNKTPPNFVFYLKIPQVISHRKRLNDVQSYVEEFLANASYLDEKLGMVFLQMMENFSPHNPSSKTNLFQFIRNWPHQVPLAIELRQTDWFNDPDIADELYQMFEEHGVTNVITDTAGRRDLLHMRLTTPYAFVRYVGANHESDYTRLDNWVDRISQWVDQGIRRIAFFVHQNHELESPLLASYFIKALNHRIKSNLVIPQISPISKEKTDASKG